MTPVSTERVAEYWRRGYLHVPRLFDAAEVAALESECACLAGEGDAPSPRGRESFPRQDRAGRPVRNLFDPVVRHSPVIRKLLETEALVDALGRILGDDARLFKDKLIVRPPGTEGYGLHQDFAYWGWTGVPADRLLAVQIAVDDADAHNGAVRFYPELHGNLLPATARDGNDIDAERVRHSRGELVPTRAGDVVIFHSLTPHASDANRSDGPRRTLYLTYNAAACGDFYRIYYQDRGAVL
jgi:ectoine hydroxylase-related dioxygenase (phytanoyl-CoA dioxygenase family)